MTAAKAEKLHRPPSAMSIARAELPTVAGVALTIVMFTIGHDWSRNFSNLWFTGFMFILLFAVMIWCSFGVVRHAEALAVHFGEPYGTLILTLSVVTIEITIMATVMLTGDPNPTLPRDTVFSVLMIVMNGMVGASIIVGALKHKQQQYSLQGAIAFLAVITSLAVISLIMPTFTRSSPGNTLSSTQAMVFAALTGLLYAGFLVIQMMRHRSFFVEAGTEGHGHHAAPEYPIWAHALLLVMTLLPVVLLAEHLAVIVDFSLEKLHAPVTLGGIVIAILVLAPEGMSSLRAAAQNHLQRSVNLSLGSALSTIGLTVPAVLIISLFIGTPLQLGLNPAEAILLGLTLVISMMTFSGAPTNILLGGVHLVLFATFIVLIFNP